MSTVGLLILVIAVLVAVVLPSIYLARRFGRNEESVAGGSMGDQFFGKKDDWGPKPTPPRT
jgi:hypothetical protein